MLKIKKRPDAHEEFMRECDRVRKSLEDIQRRLDGVRLNESGVATFASEAELADRIKEILADTETADVDKLEQIAKAVKGGTVLGGGPVTESKATAKRLLGKREYDRRQREKSQKGGAVRL